MDEILHEIGQLIKNNHAAIVGIIGSVVGYVVNFLLERWKQSGEVTFAPLEMHYNISRVGKSEPERKISIIVPSISFQFHFRVLNTYPIPKSVSVHSVT